MKPLDEIRAHLPPDDLEAFDAGTVEDAGAVVKNGGTTWRLLPAGMVLRMRQDGTRLRAAYLRGGRDVGNLFGPQR